MRLPTKYQWRHFLKILTKEEKVIFSLFLFLFLASFSFLSVNAYFKNTEIKPAAGGILTEGMVGFPRFINPIYAPANDVDRDLAELIFSGLMKYGQKGEIAPDLAKNYEVLEEGKVWEIALKENLLWSDGRSLTVDDIIFTVETVQNPDIKSPLRASWLGVEVEKISDSKIRFRLRNPYSPFLENLTLKIIPKHIWENVSPQNFPLSAFNLKPVSSGPYRLKNLIQNEEDKIISLDLVRNPNYHGRQSSAGPYIQQASFQFFENEEDLIKAAREGKINAFSLNTARTVLEQFSLYSFSLPRYFAVFFNLDPPPNFGGGKVLAEKEIRRALNYGTDKEKIAEKVLNGEEKIVDSPILPEVYGFEAPEKIYQFDLEKAKELLEKAGFVETKTGIREKTVKKELAFQFQSDLRVGSKGKEVEELQKCLANPPAGGKEVYPEGEITGHFGQKTKTAIIKFQEKYAEEILKPLGLEKGTGEVLKATRAKLNEVCFERSEEIVPLKFSLVTVNQPLLVEIASFLKQQWQELGVELEIRVYDISTLEREIIKPRNYQALLFGKVLGMIPDPFPFWHSAQKKDPGLNLAGYENKECDKLLEGARQSLADDERKEKLEKFQNILIGDAPAVFLYNPDYLYFVSREIKGIEAGIIADPSKRFADIENWYTKTKRAWK